jgi:hypothetical protein
MELIAGIPADWFIFLDADEFWIPQSGNLKTCRALAAADVLTVPRYNVPLGPAGPCAGPTLLPNEHDSLWLVTAPVPDFRLHLEEHPETPWSRGVPMAKVMARPAVIDRLSAGQHEVVARPSAVVRHGRPDDLLIAHFPFTTFKRFERKVRNITQLLQALPDFFVGHEAWHWKRWVRVAAEGRLEEEYKRQIFDQDTLEQLHATGVVRSARQIFGDNTGPSGARRSLSSQAAPPRTSPARTS